MQSHVSLNDVSRLLDEKQFGCLADLILESLQARRSANHADANDELVVNQILMAVARHLRFIDAFGETGKPHEDEHGTYHNRYDDYFKVWLGLGAFGIDPVAFNKRVGGQNNCD